MFLLILKLIIDLCCAILNAIGGYCWHNARRFIMPCFLAVGVSLSTGLWWTGFMVLPVMGTLCLGYFGGKFWGRGLWLALQAAVIGLGFVLTGHLWIPFYVAYITVALVLAGTLYNVEEVIGDLIFGGWLGVVLFLIK